VDVKITKSKMAPVKWNGEEQLAIGPSGTYNTILADQFKQAFRALATKWMQTWRAVLQLLPRCWCTEDTPFSIKDDLSDAALARQILVDNGAPTTDLRMVLGGEAMASIRGKQSVLFKANEAGTDQLLREGVIGRVMGFNLHESANIKRTAKHCGGLQGQWREERGRHHRYLCWYRRHCCGTAVKFDGDDNQYMVVAATSSAITIGAPGLRQDLADQAAVTVLSEFVPNMAFDRNAFLLAAVPRQCLKAAIPLMT
jgi:hypothetical protein